MLFFCALRAYVVGSFHERGGMLSATDWSTKPRVVVVRVDLAAQKMIQNEFL